MRVGERLGSYIGGEEGLRGMHLLVASVDTVLTFGMAETDSAPTAPSLAKAPERSRLRFEPRVSKQFLDTLVNFRSGALSTRVRRPRLLTRAAQSGGGASEDSAC